MNIGIIKLFHYNIFKCKLKLFKYTIHNKYMNAMYM